ncbi:MAG: hypothetical protein KZQ85_00235 [Candidatus Thiodiazotropha sp. (ex Myrtea sp. 'scaly one' KF741663)]|nr:hypothetical protein [Candidatus Thiodiazotropha sp. (ex Myrtea sp. 'scaly one' KF741663)]
MDNKVMRLVYSFIILICFSLQMAIASDFILFRDIEASNTPLVKINADGSGRQVVINDVEYFTITPDQGHLAAFKSGCEKKNICLATIYNLIDGTKKVLELPHAEWSDSWWSDDSVTLNFIRHIRVDDGGPACGEGDDLEGCAARAQMVAGTLSVLTGNIKTKKDFGVGQFAKLAEYENKNKTVISEAISNDRKKILRWKKSIDLFTKVSIIDVSSGYEKPVFTWKRGDFTSGITVNRHSWSPDCNHFVLNYIRGGPFSKWTIYTQNARSLERKKIATGYDPHWIINGVLIAKEDDGIK